MIELNKLMWIDVSNSETNNNEKNKNKHSIENRN